jgi:hypothetical protein
VIASCAGVAGCCDLANTLTGTLSDKTGSAVDLPDAVTFTQQGSDHVWTTNTFASPCPNWASAGMTLRCISNVWSLSGAAGFQATAVVVSVDCDSQELIFDVSFDNGLGCAGTFRIAITA